MKSKGLTLWAILLFACVFCGCKKESVDPDDPFPPSTDRTVLVYMAADNNLWSNANANVSEMLTGMVGVSGNLIVYLDSYLKDPQLIRILSNGTQEEIETYEEDDSASAEVIERVWNRTLELYPADSYGLVLWSHAMGWIPVSTTSYSSRISLSGELPEEVEQGIGERVMTKWFGSDTDAGSKLDISGLVSALPADRSIDFIIFDACLMSSIEALYDLRNTAKEILASPTEVINTGFPYATICSQLFADPIDLSAIGASFVDSYRSASLASASVALVETDQLEALAESISKIYDQHSTTYVNLSDVQYMELMTVHEFYDLEDYLLALSGGDATFVDFQTQLAKTVTYKETTPYIYSDYRWTTFEMNNYCGLSTYAPISSLPLLNACYYTTAWAKAIGVQ